MELLWLTISYQEERLFIQLGLSLTLALCGAFTHVEALVVLVEDPQSSLRDGVRGERPAH
jgi:hypothetical protein